MKIIIARHGQTTGDIEDRYGGDYDDHLTEEGQKQARLLAEKLSDKSIEVIYTSPRIRAQETTKFICGKTNLEAEIYDAIRERNSYGILTGMVKADAVKQHPKLTELLNDPHNTIEGAEVYEDFVKRIDGALKTVKIKAYETVLLVTHGGPIRVIFREILKLGEIDLGDCAYFVLETKGDGFTVKELDGLSLRTN
jgi:broad specificity phosphatase PhoE